MSEANVVTLDDKVWKTHLKATLSKIQDEEHAEVDKYRIIIGC